MHSMPKFRRKVPTLDATRTPVSNSEVRVITYRRAGHNVLAEPAGHTACCLGPDNQSLSQSWWYCRYCVSLVSRQR